MLLDHRGNPLKTSDKPIYQEIATGGERDITRNWLGPLLQTQDSILLTRGGGNLKAYEEIFRDDQVKTCVQNFIAAIVSRSWNVTAGKRRFRSPSKQDEMAADFTKEMLEGLAWDNITEKMLYGLFYGYGIAEQLFARDGQYVVWDDGWDKETGEPNKGIKVKKARRFAFDQEGRLRLLTWGDQWQGELLPQQKFWHISFGADNDDDPHGFGWAHWVYWLVRFKREGMLLWLKFLEVCGVPARIGKYPPGASQDEQNRLLRAAEALSSASAAVFPDGMILEFMQQSGKGTADNAELHDRCNAGIAKVILGQTLTTEAEGGQYKAGVQMTVREQLARAAADRLSHSFMYGPLQTLLWYNRSQFGDDVAIPQIYRDFEQEPDLNKRAEVYEILDRVGFETTEEQVMQDFGGEWKRKEQLQPQPPEQFQEPPRRAIGFIQNFTEAVAKPRSNPPEFAEPPEPEVDPIILWANQANEELGKETSGVIDRVREVVFAEGLDSLEELEQRIVGLFPELPVEKAGEILGDLFFASNLSGRYEVQQGE